MPKKSGFAPDWTSTAPPPESYRSILKWGDPNAFKHPNRRLYEMLKQKLQMTDADFERKQMEGNKKVTLDVPVRLEENHVSALRAIVGAENAATDAYSRVKFSSGKTMEEILKLRRGIADSVADLVVHPRDKEDVKKIVGYCNEHRIPIYPYGGGSSVTLAFQCARGGISLVMSTHMNRVLNFNEVNQTATVEPGILGPAYEKLLNKAPEHFKVRKRYTCGHFPQSFEYSSVGGWISALGSGQQSSYYGDACNIVLGQEYVTPAGAFKTHAYPATATGPKVNDIMKGSEGTFGVLVGATLRIYRYMPENRQSFAFVFPTWEDAVDASREISQAEFGMPSVFRISDAEETDVALKLYGVEGTPIDALLKWRGYKSGSRCLYIGQSEGERDFASNIKKKVKRICRHYGAMYITGYPLKGWEHGRFADPYMREDLNDFGVVIDTLESGVTWDNIHKLHQGVRSVIKSRPNVVCMTHASHFYPQGTNLYFIFITKMNDIEEYRKYQADIIQAIFECGGSLSHHHGIGKMIAPWMERHIGKEQMAVLRGLKRHFDPNNIMNPGGTLGLDV